MSDLKSSSAEPKYLIHYKGRRAGPITQSQLFYLLKTRQIHSSCPVRANDGSEWTSAGEFVRAVRAARSASAAAQVRTAATPPQLPARETKPGMVQAEAVAAPCGIGRKRAGQAIGLAFWILQEALQAAAMTLLLGAWGCQELLRVLRRRNGGQHAASGEVPLSLPFANGARNWCRVVGVLLLVLLCVMRPPLALRSPGLPLAFWRWMPALTEAKEGTRSWVSPWRTDRTRGKSTVPADMPKTTQSVAESSSRPVISAPTQAPGAVADAHTASNGLASAGQGAPPTDRPAAEEAQTPLRAVESSAASAVISHETMDYEALREQARLEQFWHEQQAQRLQRQAAEDLYRAQIEAQQETDRVMRNWRQQNAGRWGAMGIHLD